MFEDGCTEGLALVRTGPGKETVFWEENAREEGGGSFGSAIIQGRFPAEGRCGEGWRERETASDSLADSEACEPGGREPRPLTAEIALSEGWVEMRGLRSDSCHDLSLETRWQVPAFRL